MNNQKMDDLKNRLAEKEEEFRAIIDIFKAVLMFYPDEAVRVSASKKLDKAYKHRVKSNRRLLEALEITNPDRGEDDE